jgi:glutamate 5-kinase
VTKLAAARIAAWSGVRTVIADAQRSGVVLDAVNDRNGVGTSVRPRPTRLPARKVWIAFAVGSEGRVIVDAGAQRALEGGSSLLAPGVAESSGAFVTDDAVEVCGPSGAVFAKGLVRCGSDQLAEGRAEGVVIHRDDLVMLP